MPQRPIIINQIDDSQCIDLCSNTRRICVPAQGLCNPVFDGWLNNCADEYSCSTCDGQPYFQPFKQGDQIPFQFQFAGCDLSECGAWQLNAQDQDAFISISLVDHNTGECLLEGVESLASQYGSYLSFGQFWQNIVIDTDNFPIDIDCFRFLVEIKCPDGDGGTETVQSVCSEPWQRTKCDDAKTSCKTVLIETDWRGTDCDGRIYTLARPGTQGNEGCVEGENFILPASIRLNIAAFTRISNEISFEFNDDEVGTENNITVKTWLIEFTNMPVYQLDLLTAILGAGSQITIDGVQYQTNGHLLNRPVGSSEIFCPTLTVFQDCRKEENDC